MPLLTVEELNDFRKRMVDACNLNGEEDVQVFIESGTHYGGTITTASQIFKSCYTIEIYDKIYNEHIVPNLIPNYQNVRFILGESYRVFEVLLDEIKEPCMFWLDGHYSGGGTGKGTLDAPVNEELDVILRKIKQPCCIAIDDVRLFGKLLGEDWRNVTEESILQVVIPSGRLIKWYYVGDRMLLFLSRSNE